MAITRTAMIDDDGSGTTGTIINNAWKSELYNQIDAALVPLDTAIAAVGTWQNVAFDSSAFGAEPGMSWTVTAGQVSKNRYTLLGTKTMLWTCVIAPSTIGGTGSGLRMRIPAGRYCASDNLGLVLINNGGWDMGTALTVIGQDYVLVRKRTISNWTTPDSALYIYLTIALEVQ